MSRTNYYLTKNKECFAKKKITNALEKMRLDILEDIIEFGQYYQALLFYHEKSGENHFCDYEICITEEPTFDLEDEEELILYQEYVSAKNKKYIISPYYNIIYPGERYEIHPLKEVLYIVSCLEYPNYSVDVLVTYLNLWVEDKTPYELSQALGISKQSVGQWLNGIRPIPQARKKEIAAFLKFDIEEYSINKTEFVFDKTDL